MKGIPVIAIFDIGKTNKKFFLFDEQYRIVSEQTEQFEEILDDDGDSCDDVQQLSAWVIHSLTEVIHQQKFEIKAVNFSTYGASFVHINEAGKVVTPLYNYLKKFPEDVKQLFYSNYGGETKVSVETASPVLGYLNSGMQLYWLKQYKPEVYKQIRYSLHLPQYISYLITQQFCADITSIGCHTQLWDFQKNKYHAWVEAEDITKKLPPIQPSTQASDVVFNGVALKVGGGLHDSSAALIPYLSAFSEPFILISTGTWCISINPFSNESLTVDELQKDCLCYMEYKGNAVKAARLFAGYEHEQQTKKIATHFGVSGDFFKEISYDNTLLPEIDFVTDEKVAVGINTSYFEKRELNDFVSCKVAYHQLIADIMLQQKVSTALILGSSLVKRIFVDGGFSKNPVYMNLLAIAFPEMEVYAASVAQATAIGAALAIHTSWNLKPTPNDMIDCKLYSFK